MQLGYVQCNAIILLTLFLAPCLSLTHTRRITWWTSDPLYIRHPLSMYEGVFAALGVAGGIFAYIRAIVQLFASIRSSRALHKQLLYSILHAPLAFFDTTPLGRVLGERRRPNCNSFASFPLCTYRYADSLHPLPCHFPLFPCLKLGFRKTSTLLITKSPCSWVCWA